VLIFHHHLNSVEVSPASKTPAQVRLGIDRRLKLPTMGAKKAKYPLDFLAGNSEQLFNQKLNRYLIAQRMKLL